MPKEHPLSLVYIYPKTPRMSITNVEKSRPVFAVRFENARHRYKSMRIFDIRRRSICAAHSICPAGRVGFRSYRSEAISNGKAHISILRSKNIDKMTDPRSIPGISHFHMILTYQRSAYRLRGKIPPRNPRPPPGSSFRLRFPGNRPRFRR